MSTLTWITGKELEREVKNNGDQFLWKKNMNIRYMKVVFLLIRNKIVLHVQSFLAN